MWEKLFAVVAKAAELGPALITAGSDAVKAVEAAPTLAAKLETGLADVLSTLEALFPSPVKK